jgi:hypothetical protein
VRPVSLSCSLLRAAGRGLPGGNSLFFCFAKSKVSKRKGDPTGCVPTLRFGQPAVLGSGGVSLNSPSAQTTRSLIRLNLRSSAHPEGVGRGIPNSRTPNSRIQDSEYLKKQGLAMASPCRYWIWFWYLSPLPIGPCGCAEEHRARRIRAGVV